MSDGSEALFQSIHYWYIGLFCLNSKKKNFPNQFLWRQSQFLSCNLLVFSSISMWNISSLAGFDGEWFKSGSRALYNLRACISDSHLKDLLLYSTCRQGVLLKPLRWSQNVCWNPLILDRNLQFSCRGGGTITNPTPILFHKHSTPYARATPAGLHGRARPRGKCKTNKWHLLQDKNHSK